MAAPAFWEYLPLDFQPAQVAGLRQLDLGHTTERRNPGEILVRSTQSGLTARALRDRLQNAALAAVRA